MQLEKIRLGGANHLSARAPARLLLDFIFSCLETMLVLCSNGIKRSSVLYLDTRRTRTTLEAQFRRNLASCTAKLVMGCICSSVAVQIPKKQGGFGPLH